MCWEWSPGLAAEGVLIPVVISGRICLPRQEFGLHQTVLWHLSTLTEFGMEAQKGNGLVQANTVLSLWEEKALPRTVYFVLAMPWKEGGNSASGHKRTSPAVESPVGERFRLLFRAVGCRGRLEMSHCSQILEAVGVIKSPLGGSLNLLSYSWSNSWVPGTVGGGLPQRTKRPPVP